MDAAPHGVQKGSVEAVTMEFFVYLAAILRLGQLGRWVGRVCAPGGGVGTCVSRLFRVLARPLSLCDVHMCQVCVILLFFRVLAYF